MRNDAWGEGRQARPGSDTRKRGELLRSWQDEAVLSLY